MKSVKTSFSLILALSCVAPACCKKQNLTVNQNLSINEIIAKGKEILTKAVTTDADTSVIKITEFVGQFTVESRTLVYKELNRQIEKWLERPVNAKSRYTTKSVYVWMNTLCEDLDQCNDLNACLGAYLLLICVIEDRVILDDLGNLCADSFFPKN